MARNELTKNAMKIADCLRSRAMERTDKEITEKIGIDPSTLCRFKSEHLDKFCALLDELGFGVYDLVADKPVPQEKLRALSILARDGHDKFDEEFLGQ